MARGSYLCFFCISLIQFVCSPRQIDVNWLVISTLFVNLKFIPIYLIPSNLIQQLPYDRIFDFIFFFRIATDFSHKIAHPHLHYGTDTEAEKSWILHFGTDLCLWTVCYNLESRVNVYLCYCFLDEYYLGIPCRVGGRIMVGEHTHQYANAAWKLHMTLIFSALKDINIQNVFPTKCLP